MLIKLVYAANCLVAGWIGVTSLFFPHAAQLNVFSNRVSFSGSIQVAGALWLAIAVLSVIGLVQAESMSAVLLLQLVYKVLWLLAVALPAQLHHRPYPKAMAVFFIVWVMVLPFVIPWGLLFGKR